MAGRPVDLTVGSRVQTGPGFSKKGEIKFIGTTKFADGEWIGIRLDLPEGKNDGTVGDVKYFDSDPLHGLFVRRAQVRADAEVTSASADTREKLSLLKAKRSSMLKENPVASSSVPTMRASSSSASVGSGSSEGANAVAPTPRTSRIGTGLLPPARSAVAGSARTSTAPAAPAAPSTPPRATASAAPVLNTKPAAVPVVETPAPVAKQAASVFATPVSTTTVPTAAKVEVPAPAAAPADITPVEEEQEVDNDENVIDEETDEAAEQDVVADEPVADTVTGADAVAPAADSEPKEPKQGTDDLAEATNTASPTIERAEAAVTEHAEASAAVVAVEAPAPVQQPAPAPASAPAVAAPLVTKTVESASSAVKAEVPVAPVAAPAPAVAAPATPAPAPAAAPATKTPAVTSPQPSGPYSTPLRDASQRRLPPSRTSSMNAMSADGTTGTAGATATPSKDSALMQFMQTSIYKLNQEKDELSAQITSLTIEVANLNAHLNDSSDLTSSMQEEIERTAAEKEASQRQVKELQAQLEATKVQGSKDIAALRERVKVLENTPPPKDPRLPELERQVADLNSMVESLTLDKEQLTVEQELLDEKYLQAQLDLEEALAEVQTLTSLHEAQASAAAAHGARSAGTTEEDADGALVLATIRAENEKLREALRRLNSVSVQDKQALTTQTARLAVLEKEHTELKAYKVQAESDLLTLRSTVDSVANYEDMIETLAGKNMDLSEQLAEAKETIRDLEDTVELNDEIDQQQRAQIDSDRSVIDLLSVTVATHEAACVEKDRAVQEHLTALGRIKSANATLKAEIHRLNTLLSSEFQESKQLESKLKELASLRANQELLSAELHGAHQAHMLATSQKHKFQALYSRMDSIFGGTAVFIEESKLINTEIAFVSAATTGLEACRGLAGVLDVVLQCQSAELPSAVLNWDLLQTLTTTGAADVKVVPTLGKLYVLLLQAQGHAVQSCVDLFKPNASGKTAPAVVAPRNVQRLIDLKARSEGIAQLSSRMKTACGAVVQEWRAFCSNSVSEQALLDATAEGDADLSSSRIAPAVAGAFVPSDASAQALSQLMAECSAALNDLAEQMNPAASSLQTVDCLNVIQNCTLLASSPQVYPALKVEMLYLSINTLCDIAISQLECDENTSPEGSTAVLMALKSMKIDVKASLMNLKNNTSHFVDHLADLTGNYQLLVSCFVDVPAAGLVLNIDAAATEGMVKLVQNFIRKVNSAPGLNSTVSSTQNLMLGMTGVTKFFPFSLLTNTVAAADAEMCARLREQFDQFGVKYWLLTMQTNSDLLVAAQGSSSAAGQAAGKKAADAPASSSTAAFAEVSWRQRVVEARNLISAKFGSPADQVGADATDETAVTAEITGESPAKASSSAHNAKLSAALNELDIKRDELRAAMLRCDELQAQLDAQAEAQAQQQSAPVVADAKVKSSSNRKRGSIMPTGPDKGNTQQEVAELLKEVSTLEEALYATEQRAETLEQESKLMKAQLSLQNTLLGTSGEGDEGANKGRKRAGAASSSSSGAAASNTVSLAQYQAVLDHSNHWKRLVLKRLTASLLPLAPQHTLTPTAPANIGEANAPEPSAQPKAPAHPAALSFKHIELITTGLCGLGIDDAGAQGAPAHMSGADYASIYHKLRLARASGTRIKSIDPSAASDAKGTVPPGQSSARDRLKARNTLLYRISAK